MLQTGGRHRSISQDVPLPAAEAEKTGKEEISKRKIFIVLSNRGDDPNLIYGRNFDDEPITLDQVVTEMGEVTVHGKIINFDTRENPK